MGRVVRCVIDYTCVSDYTVGGGTIMLLENLEKVLEKLATPDRLTIVIERQPGGKMRVTSASWDGRKVLLRD